ncbi:MAG: PhzF family phenazine biosynthesis isomerase [Micromonosporaceae bacterium]
MTGAVQGSGMDMPQHAKVLRYAAFAEGPGGGNPAGVVLDARGLDDPAMQRVAADVGFSETAFAVPVAGRRWRLRYFSPRAEVAFCGHATVATAVAMAERHGTGLIHFETAVGEVVVETDRGADGRVTATFTSVPTATRPAGADELRSALAALRWVDADLDPRYPPHVANAGNDHLLLPAASRERLAALDYDYERLATLMRERRWTTVHLFWAETATTFHARDPFPPGGQIEDPATGAAAAAFAGYLRDLGFIAPPARILIHQGEDMGRPSLIRAEVVPGDRRVRVTGTAVPMTAAGT